MLGIIRDKVMAGGTPANPAAPVVLKVKIELASRSWRGLGIGPQRR